MTAKALIRPRVPAIAATAVLAANLLAAGSVQATAISDASASATLTIESITSAGGTDPAGVLFIDLFDSVVYIEDPFTLGNATATPVGTATPTVDSLAGDPPSPLAVGDTVALSATATASADATGLADPLAGTFLAIDLFNDSADSFTVEFSLAWSVAASASVDDTAREDAFSLAVVEVFNSTFILDEVFEASADALFGPPAASDGGVLSFSIVLDAFEGDSLTVFADASAVASAVPAPASLLLAGTGLLLVAARRRVAVR